MKMISPLSLMQGCSECETAESRFLLHLGFFLFSLAIGIFKTVFRRIERLIWRMSQNFQNILKPSPKFPWLFREVRKILPSFYIEESFRILQIFLFSSWFFLILETQFRHFQKFLANFGLPLATYRNSESS